MGITSRRAVLGPLDGEAGDERSRIVADTELAIEPAPDGGVVLRQETTGTPNYERIIESRLDPAEASALREQLGALLSEG